MAETGLISLVRWEWAGTELLASAASAASTLTLNDPDVLSVGDSFWVGDSGPYTVDSISEDVVTISPPLTEAAVEGEPVVPEAGGARSQSWVAEVIMPDSLEPIEVQLTASDMLILPEGVYDPPAVVTLSDDLSEILDLPGQRPIVDGSLLDPDTLPPTPTLTDELAPADAPVVNILGGMEMVYLDWAKVENPDKVTYNVYASNTPGVVTPAPEYLAGSTDATVFNMPFPVGDWYFVVTAEDADGEGPPSAEVTAEVVAAVDTAAIQEQVDANEAAVKARPRAIFSPTQPTLTADEKAIWYDTDNGHKASYWDGSTWSPYELGTGAIGQGAITALQMAAQSVNAAALFDLAVTADKVAANAVTTAKIAAGAVQAGQIANDAVGASHLAALAVTADKVAANAITTTKIAADAITAGQLAAGAVTAAKVGFAMGGGNLFRNSGFEDSTGPLGGTVNGSTIATETTTRFQGARAVKVTLPTTTPGMSGHNSATLLPASTLRPNSTYTFSAWWYNPTTGGHAGGLGLNIQGTGVPANSSGPTSTVRDQWVRQSITFTTDADAAPSVALYVLNRGAATAGEIFYVDAVQLEQGDVATSYAPKPDEILPGTITATEVADNAITAPKVIAGAIVAGKIAADAVTASEIAADSITASEMTADSVTATEITANAVTASEINAGAVTAGKVAANAITATEIAAETITAADIAADAITATEIAAGAVTASELTAGAVTAGKIAAGAIVAGDIAAGAIVAGKIAAGAVSATEIAAGAVTSEKLTIASLGASLVLNGGFEETGYWTYGATATRVTAAPYAGDQHARLTASGGVGLTSPEFPVGAGAVLAVSAYAKAVTAPTALYLRISWRNATGGEISISDPVGNTAVATTYTQYTGQTAAAPAGTVGAVFQVYNTSGTVDLDSVDVRPVTISAQISDGAITTPKVLAGAITAGTIAADAITSEKIAAGSIVATDVATDTLTADKIATNAITATEITAGAVSAVKIQTGTITANEVAASTITAAKVATDTLTASQIAADAITASEVAANAITANEIAAGTITATQIAAGSITTTTLSATAIDGMTVTGATVRTASSGARVAIFHDSGIGRGSVKFYDTSGNINGAINADDSPRRLTINGPGAGKVFIDSGNVEFYNTTVSVTGGGGASIGGGLTVTAGGMTISGSNVLNALTGTGQRYVVVGASGLLAAGASTSTLRKKINVQPLAPLYDVERSFELEPIAFEWAESEGGGAGYGVAAEQAHDLGLTPWVGYDDDGLPSGFDYAMFTVGLLAQNRYLKRRVDSMDDRLAALEAALT